MTRSTGSIVQQPLEHGPLLAGQFAREIRKVHQLGIAID
jgi:hypothetical protein